MRKNWMCKTIGLLLTGIMVFSMAACGQKEDKETESKNTEQSKETSQAVSQSSEADAQENDEISYPLDTDMKLTLWSGVGYTVQDTYSHYSESPFHQGLVERTGVEVEYSFPVAGSSATEAYNLLLTEDKLPQMIYHYRSSGELTELYNDGVIWDLTDYLPEYAPDFWAYISQPEQERELKAFKNDNGQIFQVGAVQESYFNVVSSGPVVRKDWLDACGLDMPVTMEDWEEMLIAFKDKYDAGLGLWIARFNNAGIASGTGGVGGFSIDFYVDNNEVKVGQMQPEWKEFVTIMNRWWEMGLIDPDSLTLDSTGLRSKALNGEIGVTFVASYELNNFVTDAIAENTGADWVALSYPTTEPGVPVSYVYSLGQLYKGGGVMITKSATEEEMIECLKWLNYGYTEEGQMYMNYGVEGETYTLDADGKPQWTALITENELGSNEALKMYTGDNAVTLVHEHLTRISSAEIAANAHEVWSANVVTPNPFMPLVALTTEENAAYLDAFIAMATYTGEHGLKFMTGERPIEEFDAFVEELNSLGAQEAIAAQQAGYDRWLKK